MLAFFVPQMCQGHINQEILLVFAIINSTCSRAYQCLHLSHITLYVPTIYTSAMLAFFVPQMCQGHINQEILLVVAITQNSHDSSHSEASSFHSNISLSIICYLYHYGITNSYLIQCAMINY